MIKLRMCNSFSVRHRLRWCIAFLLLLTVGVYFHESASAYTYAVYECEGGYGYRISKNEKVLIQQDFVPTREGYQAFEHKQQAKKAARLVIAKLKNKQAPALSSEEVDSILDN
ncbi:DUF4907 domain-containing protein [Carboxylicivirga mesophila]|uniref:DUF4907 domain-containing protein n=1 Tax=Carboxylicivirga mesophila TaxID=1166478 RepID=A0ABS5K9N1_9BACT|nr:DUF4907 domain-containing protein [Carboxylicivirga mesophila]MBS2211724.1 DUF4907 domain-containing protein [Carboxylicivirga mesophila]